MSRQIPILHAGWTRASSKQRGLKDKAAVQTDPPPLWLSLTIQPGPFIKLTPLGCSHCVCDQLRASPHRGDVYEHVKHLITVFNVVGCLLSRTANEEGKSISCLFIRNLQNVLNHKTHQGNTGLNRHHEEVPKPRLAVGRIHSQMTRTSYAAGKAGDCRKCA